MNFIFGTSDERIEQMRKNEQAFDCGETNADILSQQQRTPDYGRVRYSTEFAVFPRKDSFSGKWHWWKRVFVKERFFSKLKPVRFGTMFETFGWYIILCSDKEIEPQENQK